MDNRRLISMNKIYKKGDTLIIEIPLREKRDNPYMPGEDVGTMDNIAGVIGFDQWGNREVGFCQLIDMSYKGKADQRTELFYFHWNSSDEEFEDLCKKLEIGIIHEIE